MNSPHRLNAAWLNAFQISQVGVGMNRSAGVGSVQRFERSNRLDTVLYKNITLPFSRIA